MKKLAIVAVTTGVLSACGTSGTNYSMQFNNQNSAQTVQMRSAIDQAPEFMSKLPKVSGYIFENGTATSSDFGFADIKAKTIAYAKICTAVGGKIRSQVKMFKSDSGDASTEQSEMAMRSMCPDVDISGVQTVEMKHVADGNRIRTYVLVALPIGENNKVKLSKNDQSKVSDAFVELDQITKEQNGRSASGNATSTSPSKIISNPDTEVTVVKPNGSSSGLTLMPVENEEYKARRAAALQKPGAIIGQATVE
jgi:hypothetical protein